MTATTTRERMLRAKPESKPSQAAYNRAMNVIMRFVDLHQEWAEGFAYAPQVLVGMPEERIEAREEADLVEQEGLTTEQTD